MTDWLFAHDGPAQYVVLFFLLMGGAIGLPIPEDLPLLAVGVLIHEGRGLPWLLCLVAYVGIVLGDILIFQAGKRIGPALFKQQWFQKRISEERLLDVRSKLERRSFTMIFIARHLFYLRTATFLVCGAVQMSCSRFLAADMVAALVSAPIMIGLGYFGAHQFTSVVTFLAKIKTISLFVGFAMLLGLAIFFVRRWHFATPIPSPEADDLPPCI